MKQVDRTKSNPQIPTSSFPAIKSKSLGWQPFSEVLLPLQLFLGMRGAAVSLLKLMKYHDASTWRHMQHVGALICKLNRALGLPGAEAQKIVIAGWLHDIGKLSLPARILWKPGKLTQEEWALMRAHSEIGAEFVSSFPSLRSIAPLIRGHHERWDGQGYPDGLVGAEIPLGARLISVVDAYIAMTEDRSYQKARSQLAAVAELQRCAGTQFDPLVVEELMGHLSIT